MMTSEGELQLGISFSQKIQILLAKSALIALFYEQELYCHVHR